MTCDDVQDTALTKLFLRFEFDMNVEDARQRVLSVCVKHSLSFMSRDKDIIGQVSQQFITCKQVAIKLFGNYIGVINIFLCL